MKCEKCNGKGWTAEHSPFAHDHDEDGSCNGSCPVQVQCENCCGSGELQDAPANIQQQVQLDSRINRLPVKRMFGGSFCSF
jgi:hypothetical protein